MKRRPVTEAPRVTIKPAGDHLRVPVEGRPGTYLEDGEEREVRLTPFVQRLIADKDVVVVEKPGADEPTAAAHAASEGVDHVTAAEKE